MLLSDALGITASAQFTAGESVTAGQLAVMGADGLAYYAMDPNVANANMRPIVNAITQAFPVTIPNVAVGSADSAGSYPYNQARIATANLSNGNFVVAWQDTATGYVQFEIFNGLGASQGSPVSVNPGQNSSDSFISLTPLSGGGFIIGYGALISTTYSVQFAIYSNSGASVVSPTIVDSESTYGYSDISVSLLSNGNFALSYYTQNALGAGNPSTAVPRHAVYSSAGSVVLAATTLGTNSATSGEPAIIIANCALSGGGYVVVYALFLSSNAWSVSFQRFNNSGALQGSATTVASSLQIPSVYAIGLTGGGFMITTLVNATSGAVTYSYTATGVLNTSTTLSSLTAVSYYGIPTSDGGMAYVLTTGSAGTYALTTGKLSGGGSVVGSQSLSSAVKGAIGIIQLSTGAMFSVWTDNVTGYVMGALVNNAYTAITTAATAIGSATQSYYPYGVQPLQLTNSLNKTATPLLMIPTFGSSGTNFGFLTALTTIQKYSPIGVFLASATVGNPVTVQYLGPATLTTGFLQPYAVNAQSLPIKGVKMGIVGANVTLQGINSTTVRSIN